MSEIAAKDLTNLRLWRLTNESENHRGLQYGDGLIVDPKPFNPSGSCGEGGMYFFDETQLPQWGQFVEDPYWIRPVTLLPDSRVYKEEGKYKTDKFVLGAREIFSDSNLEKYVDFGKLSDSQRDQAFVVASSNGHSEVVRLLLEAGADVHARDDEALRFASEEGHVEVVRLLLEAGADVHAEQEAALRGASWYGHVGLVRLLLEAGADVHARDDAALRWASRRGHLEVVRLLLEAGADVHANHDEALYGASINGHLDVVRLLLRAGADVHANGDAALRWASWMGHLEVVELLNQASD